MQLGRIFLTVVLLTSSTVFADWPHWRGPDANGISANENIPTRWGADTNIEWKVPLAGVGTSTPIIVKGQVIVTMQIGKNPQGSVTNAEGPLARQAPDAADGTQFVVRSHQLQDGAKLWEYQFAAEGPLPSTHQKHNLASPSVVTDGKTVWAWMGTGQLVALTLDGELVWKRHIGEEHAPFDIRWGHGSSPAIHNEKLYLLCDHQEKAYLLALNKDTGKEIWKVDRSPARSYTTPFILLGEKPQLVINSSERIDILDPDTGDLLWHVGEPTRVPVSSPVFADGVMYTSRGYRSGPYMAVKADGSGEILWRHPTGAPYVSSVLFYDGIVYMATETGVGSAVDGTTGKTLWKQRLGGYFSASPVVAEGRVYMVNEEGETFVIKAGREYELVSKNELGERTLASPALTDGRIILRTDEHLVCIGGK
jgi:outer membrane protein assembly factor BamB